MLLKQSICIGDPGERPGTPTLMGYLRVQPILDRRGLYLAVTVFECGPRAFRNLASRNDDVLNPPNLQHG